MMEKRLIDANALMDAMRDEEFQTFVPLDEIDSVIDKAPTISAVPVVHGRWVKANGMMPPEYHGRKCCSVCDAFALSDIYGREWLSEFCPNCGAKMDGGAE